MIAIFILYENPDKKVVKILIKDIKKI